MIRILLSASLLGCAVQPSSAETVSKSYSYFWVGGTTLDELENELNKRGPKLKSTGQRHPGATRMQFNTRLGYAEKQGHCSIVEAKVTVNANVILPRWRKRARADQDARLVWDALSIDIKRHENQHVRIARYYAQKLERSLMRVGRQKDCAMAAQKAKAISESVLAEHEKAQVKFDLVESERFDKRLLRLMRQRSRMIQAGEIPG